MTVSQAIQFIQKIEGKEISKTTKTSLLVRLKSPQSHQLGTLLTNIKHHYQDGEDFDRLVKEVKNALHLTAKNVEQKIARTILFNTLLRTTPISAEVYNLYLTQILEALSNLSKPFILKNKDFVISEAAKAFDSDRDTRQSSLLRKVISNIDIALYYSIEASSIAEASSK
ncbi:MAG TPA: hypothetical protein VFO93_18325 [Hymenobacter sp.]|nr:hypothetical protein [Hymenobacter sp.]